MEVWFPERVPMEKYLVGFWEIRLWKFREVVQRSLEDGWNSEH